MMSKVTTKSRHSQNYSLRLPLDAAQEAERLAKKHGVSVHQVVRACAIQSLRQIAANDND